MIRVRKPLIALVATLLLSAAAPAAALDLGGHDRDGVTVGLTIGHGWNSIRYTPEGESEQDTGNISALNGGLRVGWAPSDYFIGSIGMYGWRRSYYQEQAPISTSTFNFLAEGYFFPRGEGFWIKGGIGRGSLDLDINNPVRRTIIKEAGWVYSTGAGYEFRVSDQAGIGLSYDFMYIDVGSFAGFESTKTLSHMLSMNIHFYVM